MGMQDQRTKSVPVSSLAKYLCGVLRIQKILLCLAIQRRGGARGAEAFITYRTTQSLKFSVSHVRQIKRSCSPGAYAVIQQPHMFLAESDADMAALSWW